LAKFGQCSVKLAPLSAGTLHKSSGAGRMGAVRPGEGSP